MLGFLGLWSSSKGMVLVPNLSGLTQAQAISAIQSAGLTVASIISTTSTSDSNLSNKVALQTPASGTLVDYETTVDLSIYNYVSAVTTTTAAPVTPAPTAAPVTPAPATISNLTYTATSATTGTLTWTTTAETVLFTGSATNYPSPYNYSAATSYYPSQPNLGWGGRLVNMSQNQSYTVSVAVFPSGASQTITFTHSYVVATTTTTTVAPAVTTTTTVAPLPTLPTPTLTYDTGWSVYPSSVYARITVLNYSSANTYTASLGTQNPEYQEEFNLSSLTPNQSYTVNITASRAGYTSSTGSITFAATPGATPAPPTTTTVAPFAKVSDPIVSYSNGTVTATGGVWTKTPAVITFDWYVDGVWTGTTVTKNVWLGESTSTSISGSSGHSYYVIVYASDPDDMYYSLGAQSNTLTVGTATPTTTTTLAPAVTTTTTLAPTTTTVAPVATGTVYLSYCFQGSPVSESFVVDANNNISTNINTACASYTSFLTNIGATNISCSTVSMPAAPVSCSQTTTTTTTVAPAVTTTTTVAPTAVPSGGSASLSGNSTPGSVITASTSGWSGSPTSYSIKITTALSPNIPTFNDTTVASGTTSATYTITSSDAQSPVNIFKAFATATNAGGTSTPASSGSIYASQPIPGFTTTTTVAPTTTTTTVAPATTTTTTVAPATTTTTAPVSNNTWYACCISGDPMSVSSSSQATATTLINNLCQSETGTSISGSPSQNPVSCNTTTAAPVTTTAAPATTTAAPATTYCPSLGSYVLSSGYPGNCPGASPTTTVAPAVTTTAAPVTTTAAPATTEAPSTYRICTSFNVTNGDCSSLGCDNGGCGQGALCTSNPQWRCNFE